MMMMRSLHLSCSQNLPRVSFLDLTGGQWPLCSKPSLYFLLRNSITMDGSPSQPPTSPTATLMNVESQRSSDNDDGSTPHQSGTTRTGRPRQGLLDQPETPVVGDPQVVETPPPPSSSAAPVIDNDGGGTALAATSINKTTKSKKKEGDDDDGITTVASAGSRPPPPLVTEQQCPISPLKPSSRPSPRTSRFSVASQRLSDISWNLVGTAAATTTTTPSAVPSDVEAQRKERQAFIDSFSCLNTSGRTSLYSNISNTNTDYSTLGSGSHRKNSSLFLRKLPTDILLTPPSDFEASEKEDGDDHDGEDNVGQKGLTTTGSGSSKDRTSSVEDDDQDNIDSLPKKQKRQLLSRMVSSVCLSPNYTLRTQLMLSFGSVNALTIIMMIIGSIVATTYVGDFVAETNRDLFQQNVVRKVQVATTRYLAESLEAQFMPLDLVNILREATQDRFQGYPKPFLSDDEIERQRRQRVPFKDIVTGQNVYPIQGNSMPLGWEIPSDINETNYEEHVQRLRWDDFYQHQVAASTANGVFYMQGACNPDETNSSALFYWENCTDANNNITTGGIIQPTPLTSRLYETSKDLVPLLKAMFESTPEIQDLGLYFANMGAGAVTSFPAYPLDTQATYTSQGCDWMAKPNPIDPSLGPIGTPEEIARCHAKDVNVSNVLFNPLESNWCRDQALNPHRLFTDHDVDTWNPGRNLIQLGRAIYDRETNAFIACTIIAISLAYVETILQDARVTPRSHLTLVQFGKEGKVIASTVDHATGSVELTIDELDVGISKESYQHLSSLVDFDSLDWDAEKARESYQNFIRDADGYFVAVSTIPRIPEQYDENYIPAFFIVSSSSKKDIFNATEDLTERVDEEKKEMIKYAILVGAIGLVVTTIIIFFMSKALTSPLHYINKTAEGIVHGFGEKSRISINENDDEDESKSRHVSGEVLPSGSKDDGRMDSQDATPNTINSNGRLWCTPRTELTDVLDEFNLMVANFSGSLLAKSEKGKRIEVRNKFDLRNEFASLYASRKKPSFAYNLDTVGTEVSKISNDINKNSSSSDNNNEDSETLASEPGFIHIGSNIEEPVSKQLPRTDSEKSTDDKRKGKNEMCSRIFLWTAVLLVTPLLSTSIAISGLVYHRTRLKFDHQIDNVENLFVDLRKRVLVTHAKLRADVVSSMVQVSVRDLYFLTRYYSWLLFGGIVRTDSFTELLTGVETCKYFSDDYSQCPFVEETSVCDCAWNGRLGSVCQNYPDGSRYLQRASFSVEATNFFPDGDRNFSTFPNDSTSPNTTLWWDGVDSVPGLQKGSLASGYDTLYDRLRVASAMPLLPVLYNYDSDKTNYIAQYIAFEADGLFLGYRGCKTATAQNSGWNSTKENRAADFRPKLCPLGKYGFDPRCREWYDTGRKLAFEENVPLYVTAPYLFAANAEVAQSATSPLIDPNTGVHVGQVLVDFFSHSAMEALENKTELLDSGWPVLIAVQVDRDKDTVIGPGFKVGDKPIGISRLILSFDYDCNSTVCKENRDNFEVILDKMEKGENGTAEARRSTSDEKLESFAMAYYPIKVRSIRPLDSSNFARGIEVSDHLIYSMGFCELIPDIKEPFPGIKNELAAKANLAIAFLIILMFFSTLLSIYISYIVATFITERMLYLLDLIRFINRSDFEGELPKFENNMGSREIANVATTVVVLYKIVRAANDFYFAGELEMAYAVLVDALRIFKRLGNKKAVAVASNNLGNVLLAMYTESQESKSNRRCSLTTKEIIGRGTGHFHVAITYGEKAYDTFYVAEGWTPNCLDFMQHLSNRYFNRALFLLLVKDDHEKPEEIEKLGIRDLTISRDMDFEIVEYGKDVGFNRENRAHKLFSVNLIRARGHNILLELGYPDAAMAQEGYPEEWGLGELLDENFKLLQMENRRDSSELFTDVNVLGRLQEIETELIKYKMMNDDVETAARIAIRMLHEDAYVFVEAMSVAADALMAYVDTMTEWNESTRSRVKRRILGHNNNVDAELMGILDNESGRGTSLTSSTEEVSLVRATSHLQSSASLHSFRQSAYFNWVKKQVSGGFVTMEDF